MIDNAEAKLRVAIESLPTEQIEVLVSLYEAWQNFPEAGNTEPLLPHEVDTVLGR